MFLSLQKRYWFFMALFFMGTTDTTDITLLGKRGHEFKPIMPLKKWRYELKRIISTRITNFIIMRNRQLGKDLYYIFISSKSFI